MWYWTRFGDQAVEWPHGIIPRDELAQFEALQDLLQALRQDLDEVRERAHAAAEAARAAAEQQAAARLKDAQAEAEALCRQAHAQGLQQGHADAAAEWHARHHASVLRQQDSLKSQREGVARLVVAAVEQMVTTEAPQARFEKALSQVGELSRGGGVATLRVHPGERAAAQEAVRHTANLREASLVIEVLADSGLPLGGCVFESDLGMLDASLEVQLAGLKRLLDAEAERQSGSDPEPPHLDDDVTSPR